MKWLEAGQLELWAQRIDARTRLSEIVAQLVRASVDGIEAFDFPTGDSAQRPGYDGRLQAIPADGFREFLPDDRSVWEFGTSADYHKKANDDYLARTAAPGDGVNPSETTFLFVTPRRWVRDNPTLADWVAAKKAEGPWKDVRVIDALALESWFEQCPAVAASVARDIVGTLPVTGVLSTNEYWKEYSSQFDPHLREEVLIAGRNEQVKEMVQALLGSPQIHRWLGDSLAEVLAFMIASIQTSDENVRKFLESRVLLLESKDAARRLCGTPNLIFSVRGEATELAGMLANSHPVICPLGRDSLKEAVVTRLNRPSSYEVSKALQTMGINEAESHRLALECDRSVTILARRIPSATAKRPRWHGDEVLIPALLAGAWNTASPEDCAILAGLAGETDYAPYEAKIRRYREVEDAPLESAETVWAIRAPVDVFVNLANLLGPEHFERLEAAAQEVFGKINPALELAIEDRPFARLRGASQPYSAWLREGLANTLLIVAALGEKSGVLIKGGKPQHFINAIVAGIPALRDSDRVMSSLSHELPLLMEAAPDPLLFALEHLLEGDGQKLLPIFQDSKEHSTFFSSSPHTGFLWALETIAWDPQYLSRSSAILLKLSKIDPGGTLSNRPLRSLRHVFLPWLPGTNAPLRERLVVLDELLESDEATAWPLLVKLLPKGHDVGEMGGKLRYREAGASERERVTRALVYETYSEIIRRAIAHARGSVERWKQLFDTLHTFPKAEQDSAIDQFETQLDQFSDSDKALLWEKLAGIVRHHRAYPTAQWTLREDVRGRLEGIVDQLKSNDPIQEALWLFDERPPIVEFKEGKDVLAEAEELRRNAIHSIWNQGGADAVLSLADRAKAARYVGLAFGYVVPDVAQAVEISSAAFSRGEKFDDFVSLLSAVVFDRFGTIWLDAIRRWHDSGELNAQRIVALALSWPHERLVWDFVGGFGVESARLYWQTRLAWGIKGDATELAYAVRQYLDADRAESIVTALYPRAKEIPGPLLLEVLDQFEARIGAAPSILKHQSLDFDLQQLFGALRERTDVTSAEIAVREYRYLPLLRETRVFSDETHSLALDKFMVESPEFFVKIICDVFSPASDRGSEKKEVSESVRNRAQVGWMLLDGFTSIPGHAGNEIDIDVLKNWVAEVRRLSEEKDRLVIAEQKVGALLAHSPIDPQDKQWPHLTIRRCLEAWKSDEIERGMIIERLNMRGGTWRDPREGGEQERALANDMRTAAKEVNAWPRTRRVYSALADHWEESAKHEDIQTRQRELRD